MEERKQMIAVLEKRIITAKLMDIQGENVDMDKIKVAENLLNSLKILEAKESQPPPDGGLDGRLQKSKI